MPHRPTHHEVLQEPRAALEAKVGTSGEVTGLLEKDGVGAVDLADVDLDVLRVGEGVVQVSNSVSGAHCSPRLLICAASTVMRECTAGGSKRGVRNKHAHSSGR